MTVHAPLRIGARRSRLASTQGRLVQAALHLEADASRLVAVSTHGDAISARHTRGGFEAADGQFTAELEEALLRDEVDVAVHSYKDLPTQSADGLVVAAILPRADPRDCLLTRDGRGLDTLADGARIGTSSARRTMQLLAVRPDLRIEPIRGNVETRIARMERGEYDGMVLACAGLDRLGIPIPEKARLAYDIMLPAPAQGALAIQVRADRTDLRSRVAGLEHAPTRIAVEAERALLRAIGGGCLAPLGAVGEVSRGQLRLRAAYFGAPSAGVRRVDLTGPARRVEELVAEAARRLLTAGVDA